jgi:hypothetical protein
MGAVGEGATVARWEKEKEKERKGGNSFTFYKKAVLEFSAIVK